jgi:hypothetical protein
MAARASLRWMRSAVFGSTLAIGLSSSAAALGQYGQPAPTQSQPPAQTQYGQPPPGQGQYGSAPAAQPGIEAGGLAPPSSTPPETPAVAETEEKLDDAEKKDTGRGLEWFYLNAEIGFEHLGLQTFSANNVVDANLVDTTQTGPLYGAGLGARIVFITVGARFRIATFTNYDLWTLNGEVGLRIPLGKLEPYFSLGGGYASLGSFSGANIKGGSGVTVGGYDIRAGGGLDYYITPVFSVGAALTFEVVGLTRSGSFQALTGNGSTGGGVEAQVQAADGTSVGSAFAGTFVAGLHF